MNSSFDSHTENGDEGNEVRMKFIHLASLRTASENAGVVQQMTWEKAAAEELGLPWQVELWTKDASAGEDSVLRTNPGWMGNFLLRRLHFHLRLRRAARDAGGMVIRHAPLDPFFQFLPRRVRENTWYVFHTKTEDYLRSRGGRIGGLFAWLDRVLTRRALRDTPGIIGVTDELVEHERMRLRMPNLKGLVYPNGLHLADWEDQLSDVRDGVPKVVFIASQFHSWNGLEAVLQSMVDSLSRTAGELHLVGRLLPSQRAFIAEHNLQDIVIEHGSLDASAIQGLLPSMDLSLGAFALHAIDARSACTLKVRESLKAGVPVYAGHHDVGLEDIPDCYRIGAPDWEEILRVAAASRKSDKGQVRRMARPRIDKTTLLERLYEQLCR